LRDSLFGRLLAGLLIVSLVPAVTLSVLLVREASNSLEDQAQLALERSATATAARIDDWVAERRSDLRELAQRLRHEEVPGPDARDLLVQSLREGNGWLGLVVLDPAGARTEAAGGEIARVEDQDFFEEASAGRSSMGEIEVVDDLRVWHAAEPVRASSGQVEMILAGQLDAEHLDGFAEAVRSGDSGEVLVQDDRARVVARAAPGEASSSDTDGADPAAVRALDGRTGAHEYTDARGTDVIGGYAPISELGWAAVVKQSQDEAYAEVDDERNLAIWLLIVVAAVAVGLAVLFARRAPTSLARLV
jgi:methyl-accepting chemotaxis protein